MKIKEYRRRVQPTPLPIDWGDWIIDRIIPTTINVGLLAIGAATERFFPSALFYYLAISGLGVLFVGLCILASFVHMAMYESDASED
jgi:hypothetical protein